MIEHPETGSLATIRTTVPTFQSDPPVKGKKRIYRDVRLESGAVLNVSLLAPLVVEIPR